MLSFAALATAFPIARAAFGISSSVSFSVLGVIVIDASIFANSIKLNVQTYSSPKPSRVPRLAARHPARHLRRPPRPSGRGGAAAAVARARPSRGEARLELGDRLHPQLGALDVADHLLEVVRPPRRVHAELAARHQLGVQLRRPRDRALHLHRVRVDVEEAAAVGARGAVGEHELASLHREVAPLERERRQDEHLYAWECGR